MDIIEATFLEELVHREGHPVPDAGHGPEGVRARPQVGDFSKEFEGVGFFSAGGRCRRSLADDPEGGGLHFELLARAGEATRTPSTLTLAPVVVFSNAAASAGSVAFSWSKTHCIFAIQDHRYLDENGRFGLPLRAHPALHGDGLSFEFRR